MSANRITFADGVARPSFQGHAIPFPIILGDSLSTHENDKTVLPGDQVPLSNPIYEFNPCE